MIYIIGKKSMEKNNNDIVKVIHIVGKMDMAG